MKGVCPVSSRRNCGSSKSECRLLGGTRRRGPRSMCAARAAQPRSGGLQPAESHKREASTAVHASQTELAPVGSMDTATVDIVSDSRRKRDARRKFTSAEALAYQLPGRNTAGERVRWGKDTQLLNEVQLSAYPDCIGGDLASLQSFVSNHLNGVVGGVHVLPFYPSSADRGFAPLTYKEVDPQFGSWDQITALAELGDLVVDFMVNHISAKSNEFLDFEEKGDESEWADLFIRYNKFWGGEPTEEELSRIYTRKPRPPYREVTHADNSTEKVWCTFDSEQIDIDVFSDKGRAFIDDQLRALCAKGVNLIRLDAFGYTTKRRGTNCFFVEPEVWQLLERVRGTLAGCGTELLCEVHEHYSMQKRIAEQGYWVYDFALPLLSIQALYDSDASNLKSWLLKCPRNQVTTLDTHDGLGVVDVADLMTQDQIDRTKENIFKRGASANMRYNSAQYGNLDVYQINCTFYSAVGNNDAWYLLARAIQLFTPGIPLIYYVGLLAGPNDIERVERTKTGRDINRHPFTLDEAIAETERPVVKLLFELCRFRNNHPAFNGKFELLDTLDEIRQSVVYVPQASVDFGDMATGGRSMPGGPAESRDVVMPGGDAAGGGVFVPAGLRSYADDGAGAGDFLADVCGSSVDILASIDSIDDIEWQLDQIIGGTVETSAHPERSASAAPGGKGDAGGTQEHEVKPPMAGVASAAGVAGVPNSACERPGVPCPPDVAQLGEKESGGGSGGGGGGDGGGEPLRTRSTRDDGSGSSSSVDSDGEPRRRGAGGRRINSEGHSVLSSDSSGSGGESSVQRRMSRRERLFQPYSAALANQLSDECLMSPEALASIDITGSALAEVRRIRNAVRQEVDPMLELPRNVLCMKWRNGAHWAVLEANLESKEFRILYVDPYDGQQKSWNVSLTLEAYTSLPGLS